VLAAKDLIRRCLVVEPSRRITIQQFLMHPWINGQQTRRMALKSPAVLREVDNKVVRMKEVFDVSCAAQRDVADGYQPVFNKNPFMLNNVGSATLLEKRSAKVAKSSDVVATAAVKTVSVPKASSGSLLANGSTTNRTSQVAV